MHIEQLLCVRCSIRDWEAMKKVAWTLRSGWGRQWTKQYAKQNMLDGENGLGIKQHLFLRIALQVTWDDIWPWTSSNIVSGTNIRKAQIGKNYFCLKSVFFNTFIIYRWGKQESKETEQITQNMTHKRSLLCLRPPTTFPCLSFHEPEDSGPLETCHDTPRTRQMLFSSTDC